MHTNPKITEINAYGLIFAVLFFQMFLGVPHAFAACTNNSDPLGLANGTSVLFIDKNNCNCRNSAPGESIRYATNPAIPMCSFKSLDEGMNGVKKLLPGDTVYIRAGDYGMTAASLYMNAYVMIIRSAGTATDGIAIKAYPNTTGGSELVTIRGSSNLQSTTSQHLIYFERTHYLTLDSLHFVGFENTPATPHGRTYIPYLAYLYNANHIQIKNSSFHDYQGNDDDGYGQRFARNANGSLNALEGAGTAVHAQNVDGLTVQNSSFRGIDGPSRIVGRIDIFGGDGLLCDNCKNTIVQDSTFLDSSHVSLNFRNSENVIVERNTINNRLHTGFSINNITGNPGSATNAIIRNNVFFGTNEFPSQGNLLANHIQIGPGNIQRNFIYNNIIYNGFYETTGIIFVEDVNLYTLTDQYVFNNTIYNPGNRGISIGNFNWTNPPGRTNAISRIHVWNNILIGANSSYSGPNSGPSLSADIVLKHYKFVENNGYGDDFKNNLIYPAARNGIGVKSTTLQDNGQYVLSTFTPQSFNTLSPIVKDTVSGDPLFSDVAGHDFHIQAASPAASSGLCLHLVENGFNVSVTPGSAGCHIGAFPPNASEVPRPDVAPPVVSITSPANGSVVSGVTVVGSGASDDVAVDRVEFRVDNGSPVTVTASPYQFSWDTTVLTDRSAHTIEAKAYDRAGNRSAALINVTVNNAANIAREAGAIPTQKTIRPSKHKNTGIPGLGGVGGIGGVGSSGAATNTLPPVIAAPPAKEAEDEASDPVAVTGKKEAIDTLPPKVSIISPADGTAASGDVPVQVSVSDDVGVTRVELYVDGIIQTALNAAPFNFTWDMGKATSGPHTLQCKTYDAAGNIGVSSIVTVKK